MTTECRPRSKGAGLSEAASCVRERGRERGMQPSPDDKHVLARRFVGPLPHHPPPLIAPGDVCSSAVSHSWRLSANQILLLLQCDFVLIDRWPSTLFSFDVFLLKRLKPKRLCVCGERLSSAIQLSDSAQRHESPDGDHWDIKTRRLFGFVSFPLKNRKMIFAAVDELCSFPEWKHDVLLLLHYYTAAVFYGLPEPFVPLMTCTFLTFLTFQVCIHKRLLNLHLVSRIGSRHSFSFLDWLVWSHGS